MASDYENTNLVQNKENRKMFSAKPRSNGETSKLKPEASTKPLIKVDSSFTVPIWPTIDSAQQDVILKLLYTLLEPIGHHRSNHVIRSRGIRSQKRKRTKEEKNNLPGQAPQQPEMTKYLNIGFNSTFRHAQVTIKLSESSHPQAKDETFESNQPNDGIIPQAETEKQTQPNDAISIRFEEEKYAEPATRTPNHLSCIFLTQPSPSTHIPYTALPFLSRLASSRQLSLSPTRLVPLSIASEVKLCKALGISRVGIIGIFDGAPGPSALMEYVRNKVEVVDVPWVKEVNSGDWLGTKIMFGEEDRMAWGVSNKKRRSRV